MRIFLAALLALSIVAAQFFYGGASRTVFGMLSYALLALAGCLTLVVVFWRRAVSPNALAVLSVLVMGGYLLWRSLHSPGQDISVFYTFLVAGCLVAYLVSASVMTTPASRYVFVSILLAAAMVQVVVAAVQFTAEKPFFPIPWFSEQLRIWNASPVFSGVRRGQGFFLSANQLPWLLNTMAFFALGVAAFGRCKLGVRILFAYLGGVCLVGVLLTLSRGGVVGLGVGMVIFAVLSLGGLAFGARDRRFVFLLASVATALVAMAGAYVFFQNSDTVRARLDRIAEDSYRVNLWGAAVRQTQIEPVLGTGAGSFTQLSRRLSDFMEGMNDMFAHNDWAQLAADYGFVGLALLAVAFVLNLRAGLGGFFRALRERMAVSSRPQSNSAAFLVGASSATLASAAHSFFDYNMQIPANAILASVCLGVLANSGLPGATRTWRSAITRITTALAAVACGAVLLALLNRHALVEYESLRAENELLQGNLASAREISESALARHPGHSRLHRVAGEACLRSVRPAPDNNAALYFAAVSQFRLAIKADPDERWNHLLLGMALVGLEDGPGSREAHVEAIRLDPGSPVLREYYALSLEQLDRIPEAMRAYEVALQVPGTKFARERLAALRARDGSR